MAEVLLGLMCFLVFVTVVGHGLWLLFAAVFRVLSGEVQAPPPQITWPADDNRVARRVIHRLYSAGKIAPDEYHRLCGLLDESQQPAAVAQPASSAVPEASPQIGPGRHDSGPHEPKNVGATEAPPSAGFPYEAGGDAEEVYDAQIVDDEQPIAEPPQSWHPLDRPESAEPQPTARGGTGHSLADVLTAFMQERNIRWGELVSGLLIVVSAVGLVISLRYQLQTLSERFLFFPSLLFLLATAAVHGAGMYTLRRWKLHATSRGVLVIGVLLIPLNFLALAILVAGPDAAASGASPLYWLASGIALICFSGLAYVSARALDDDRWLALFVTVMGPSAGLLLIGPLAGPDMNVVTISMLVLVPVGSFLAAHILQLRPLQRPAVLSLRDMETALMGLGVGAFSCAVAVALILFESQELRTTVANLAPMLSVAGASVMAVGLFLQRRADETPFATMHLVALSIAILGGFLLLMLTAAAWPYPALLIAVGLLNGVVLLALAHTLGPPVLSLPGVVCLTLAYLLAFHGLQGAYPGTWSEPSQQQLLDALFMGRSALALLVAAAVAGAAARWSEALEGPFTLTPDTALERPYVLATLLLGGMGLLLCVLVGFLGGPGDDVALTTPVLLGGSIAAIAVAAAGRWPVAAWVGSLGLFIAYWHAFGWNEPVRLWLDVRDMLPQYPLRPALLMHAAGCMLAAWVVDRVTNLRRWTGTYETLVQPLGVGALAGALLALPLLLRDFPQTSLAVFGALILVAAIWLVGALLLASSWLLVGCQLISLIATSYGVATFAQQYLGWSVLEASHLLLQLGVVSVWPLGTSALRQFGVEGGLSDASSRMLGRRLLSLVRSPASQQLDMGLLGLLTLGLIWIVIGVCLIGLGRELALVPLEELRTGLLFAEISMGWPGWFAWVMVAAGVVVMMREVRNVFFWQLSALLAAVPACLLATAAAGTGGMSAGLRWGFAIYGGASLLYAAAAWVRNRRPISTEPDLPAESSEVPGETDTALRAAGRLAMGIGAAIVLLLTCVEASVGPQVFQDATAWLVRLRLDVGYGVPLALIAAALVGWAILDQRPVYMLLSAGVVSFITSGGVLLPVWLAGETAGLAELAKLVVWNSAALSGVLLLWETLSFQRRPWVPLDSEPWGGFMQVPVGVLSTLLACWFAWMFGLLLSGMSRELVEAAEAGAVLSGMSAVLALLLAAVAAGLFVARYARPWRGHVPLAAIFMFALMLGGQVDVRFPDPDWYGIVTASAGWLLLSAAMVAGLFVSALPATRHIAAVSDLANKQSIGAWMVITSAGVLILAGVLPRFADFSTGSGMLLSVAAAGLLAVTAWQLRGVILAGLATIAAVVAANTGWREGVIPRSDLLWLDFALWHVLAVSCAVLVWLAVTLTQKDSAAVERFARLVRALSIVSVSSLLVLAWLHFLYVMVIELLAISTYVLPATFALWLVLAGVCLSLTVVSAWERKLQALFGPLLFCCGLAFVALGLIGVVVPFGADASLALLGLAVTGYVALAARGWRSHETWISYAQRLGVPRDWQGRGSEMWFPAVGAGLTFAALLLGFWIVLLAETRWMRFAAAAAAFPAAWASLNLMHAAATSRRLLGSLLLIVFGGVLLAWADVGGGRVPDVWLARSIRLVIVLAAASFVFSGPLARRITADADWRWAFRQGAVLFGGGALVGFACLLVLELLWFDAERGAPVPRLEAAAMAVMLIGLTAALTSMALSPQRDPLGLSPRGRQIYVYTGQLVLALLAAHVYLVFPMWFTGFFEPYWPFIVLAIAAGGIAVAELLRRRGLFVLAEPFERTGAFLPMLPAVALWAIAAPTPYWLVLFMGGLVYVLLSLLRPNVWSAAAAVVMGNFALWAFWHERQWLWYAHPQLWLIPPALSVVIAAQLIRHRLTVAQLAAVRYAGISVIYLSSTTEMFIRGLGTSLWPPLVLLTLSVFGVLVGIALEVRAFLFLGTAFVVLSLVSMVWHAYEQLDHVGVWWAFGIVMGITILTMFGLFEKNRPEITRLAERLRNWDA